MHDSRYHSLNPSSAAHIGFAPDSPRPAPAAAEEAPSVPGTKATLAVCLAGICAFLDLYATQPLLPLFEHVFKAGKSSSSLTVSATTIAVALAAPFAGIAAERLGKKNVIVGSIFLVALPTLLAATATSLEGLVFWRFVTGLLLPAAFAVTIGYVTEEWPAEKVGSAMAALIVGNVIGGFGGRLVAGTMAAWGGWPSAFVALGCLNIVGGVLTWLWLPRGQCTHDVRPVAEVLRGTFAHLRNPRLLAVYAVGFNLLFSMVATFTYVTFYLAGPPFGLPTHELSLIFIVYVVGVFTTPIAGRWLDRAGARTVLVVMMLVAAAGVGLALVHDLPVIIVGLTVCSAAIFVCQSAATSFIQQVAPAGTRASAAGLYVSVYYAGGSLGGVLPGLVWGFGGWPACVALIVGVQCTAALIAARWWQRRARYPGGPGVAAALPVSE